MFLESLDFEGYGGEDEEEEKKEYSAKENCS
jgi:hypothetical protein